MARTPISYNPQEPISQPLSRNPIDGLLPRSPEQNPDNSSYSDMLQRLTDMFGDDFASVINSLGINGKDTTSGQEIKDWNKQLLDTLINYLLQRNEREYNRSLQLEQRQYDLPQAQLSRLMAAGLSRDAAIKLLSGAGSGSSTGVPYSSGLQAAEGLSPSESAANEIQTKTAVANAVFDGVGCVASLVGLGFSIPQAIAQTKYLQNSNVLTNMQIKGFQSAQQAYKVMMAAGASAESFASLGSAVDFIKSAASDGDAACADFIAQGGIDDLHSFPSFSSKTLADLYGSERQSESLDKFIENQDLQNKFTEVSTAKTSLECANIAKDTELKGSQIAVNAQAICESEAKVYVLNEQGKYIQVQNKYANKLFSSTARKAAAEANIAEYEADLQKDVMPVIKDFKLDELNLKAKTLKGLNDEDAAEKYVKQWCQDADNAYLFAYLENIRLNAERGFSDKYKGMYALAQIFHKYGVSNYVRFGEEQAEYMYDLTPGPRAKNGVLQVIDVLSGK